MTTRKVAKTCLDLYKEAREKAQHLFDCRPKGSIKHFTDSFWRPEFAVNPDGLEEQTAQYLYCRVPCGPAVGNNAEEVCACSGCGDCGCGCGDVITKTGCDDPNKCANSSVGWNYVALARAAEHAVSLAYVPYRIRDIQPGDMLIWDPDATPDNLPCDPCVEKKRGAFVNRPSGILP